MRRRSCGRPLVFTSDGKRPEQILARDPGLGGLEEMITVMFVDIRGFTKRSATDSAAEIVMLLNGLCA